MNSTPTIDDLKNIFHSELYQQTLIDYDNVATYKLDEREEDATSLYNILDRCKRDFRFIGLTTEQVIEHFEKIRIKLVSYTIYCTEFFMAEPEDDGEFPEGEELDEKDKSVTLKVFGITKTFLLDKFCELYILETMDKERLLEYLKITRMPGAKKYAGQITKLYKQLRA